MSSYLAASKLQEWNIFNNVSVLRSREKKVKGAPQNTYKSYKYHSYRSCNSVYMDFHEMDGAQQVGASKFT